MLGASNGGLLVPGACARVFLLGGCVPAFLFKMPNTFVPCKAAFRPPGDTAGEETVLRYVVCRGALTLGGAGGAHVSAHGF